VFFVNLERQDNSSQRGWAPAEPLQQLVQQIEHADEVGLDVFGLGERYRRESLAPAVILSRRVF
jgi:hypothetical protein